MPNLTKKDVERLLIAQTKQLGKTIGPLEKTLDRSTALLAKLSEDFRDFREDMKNVPSTLDSHTTTLDAIFKNTEHWRTEAAALRSAIKRHERWFSQIAAKVGIELEGLPVIPRNQN